jgi:hypothetical protein
MPSAKKKAAAAKKGGEAKHLFLRDTYPQETGPDEAIRKGERVALRPDQVARWVRRGAIAAPAGFDGDLAVAVPVVKEKAEKVEEPLNHEGHEDHEGETDGAGGDAEKSEPLNLVALIEKAAALDIPRDLTDGASAEEVAALVAAAEAEAEAKKK